MTHQATAWSASSRVGALTRFFTGISGFPGPRRPLAPSADASASSPEAGAGFGAFAGLGGGGGGGGGRHSGHEVRSRLCAQKSPAGEDMGRSGGAAPSNALRLRRGVADSLSHGRARAGAGGPSMRTPLVLLAIAGLAFATALVPVAEASHRCYTIGDYQVCRHIPGDEILDDLRDGCVEVGLHYLCLA